MIRRVVATVALVIAGTMALAQTVPISELRRGQSVTVEGVVERFFDTDEIRLTDDSGSVRVYLGPQTVPVKTGERLVIEGVMDDDLIGNELYARSITRENGEVIAVTGTYD